MCEKFYFSFFIGSHPEHNNCTQNFNIMQGLKTSLYLQLVMLEITTCVLCIKYKEQCCLESLCYLKKPQSCPSKLRTFKVNLNFVSHKVEDHLPNWQISYLIFKSSLHQALQTKSIKSTVYNQPHWTQSLWPSV